MKIGDIYKVVNNKCENYNKNGMLQMYYNAFKQLYLLFDDGNESQYYMKDLALVKEQLPPPPKFKAGEYVRFKKIYFEAVVLILENRDDELRYKIYIPKDEYAHEEIMYAIESHLHTLKEETK